MKKLVTLILLAIVSSCATQSNTTINSTNWISIFLDSRSTESQLLKALTYVDDINSLIEGQTIFYHLTSKKASRKVIDSALALNPNLNVVPSPLVGPIFNEDTLLLNYLVTKGADVNGYAFGYSLIEYAMVKKKYAMFDYLIKLGAEIDGGNHGLLTVAIIKDDSVGAEKALALGSNINGNGKGLPPIIYSLMAYNDTDLKYDQYTGKLKSFVRKADRSYTNWLINRGADVNVSSSIDGMSALDYEAFRWGSVDMMKTLILNGANPNQIDFYGAKPIHYAMRNRRSEAVDFLKLRTNGDYLSFHHRFWGSPLMLAIQSDNESILDSVLSNPELVYDYVTSNGNTAMLSAAQYHKEPASLIQALIQKKIDPNFPNYNYGSASYSLLARYDKNSKKNPLTEEELLSLLNQMGADYDEEQNSEYNAATIMSIANKRGLKLRESTAYSPFQRIMYSTYNLDSLRFSIPLPKGVGYSLKEKTTYSKDVVITLNNFARNSIQKKAAKVHPIPFNELVLDSTKNWSARIDSVYRFIQDSLSARTDTMYQNTNRLSLQFKEGSSNYSGITVVCGVVDKEIIKNDSAFFTWQFEWFKPFFTYDEPLRFDLNEESSILKTLDASSVEIISAFKNQDENKNRIGYKFTNKVGNKNFYAILSAGRIDSMIVTNAILCTVDPSNGQFIIMDYFDTYNLDTSNEFVKNKLKTKLKFDRFDIIPQHISVFDALKDKSYYSQSELDSDLEGIFLAKMDDILNQYLLVIVVD